METRREQGLSLSARLLHVQDEERRRISRELHDSVGQCLAAVQMSLEMLGRAKGDNTRSERLRESVNLVNEAIREVRTVSYLLHPPMLDLAGLGPAIQWYAEGFDKRSEIKLHLEMPEDLPRLPIEIETAAFRVVQECLTNVHRYSQASNAWIRIDLGPAQFCLQVEDDGKGIAGADLVAEPQGAISLGVGIPGMRERLTELGGTLEIQSNERGTCVIAAIPLAQAQRSKSKPDLIVLPAIEPRKAAAPKRPPENLRSASRKRILIVDDHELMRRGVRALVENESDLEVCGEATNASEAIEMTEQLRPDLVLLDLEMPGRNGWEVVRGLRRFGFWTRIVIFTAHDLPAIARGAQAAKCEGYLAKSRASSELIHALRAVLTGQTYYHGQMAAAQTA